ncbi:MULTISPECIES: hypothetical protein [Desulfococcus]|jgi:hypothetical protein|uniref:Uncharacterized protein n=1 Tax=Desulfococcus multivorans DSM 2059 TaxID=1121405 RepID=S7TZK4_DESML|nr:hypothetical protein [Desulfococcus multivorans]AOY60183.1 conserved uncharacterized protein [Desulfococcus multivorans]AQV02311.1 hypothetical protein B2D07_17070 [Desulfococcus multivorans]EPR42165.1 hypothetical protein dsmv_1682 [Desulfococcus multivorans DSM 2059]SKA06437.1 hypothetical protein SAMN02745446_02615 [Desulfococcus multivorans DSM 2059]
MKENDTNRKKITAALSAVAAYIKSGEEMAAMQGPPAEAPPAPEKPAPMPSLWGVGGRQDIMQMRNLMQMKAFHVKRG